MENGCRVDEGELSLQAGHKLLANSIIKLALEEGVVHIT